MELTFFFGKITHIPFGILFPFGFPNQAGSLEYICIFFTSLNKIDKGKLMGEDIFYVLERMKDGTQSSVMYL